MAVYHGRAVPAVPARGHEALPQGRALLHGQVRDRAPRLRAGRARQEPPDQGDGLRRCSCARSRRRAGSTASSSGSSATTSRRRPSRKGVTGEMLLQMLETRLDNVRLPAGLRAVPRPAARQLVRHGHFTVNGRKVDIPSFLVRPGDEMAVREKSRKLPVIVNSLEARKGAERARLARAEPREARRPGARASRRASRSRRRSRSS